MPDGTEITEFADLSPDELHLVRRGANGFPPLLAKAVAEEIENAQKGESEEIEETLTGEAEKSLCGLEDCEVCAPLLAKAKLKAKQRNSLSESEFALPGQRKYPIHDESHARNALSRVSQYGTSDEKRKVRAAVHRRYPEIGAEKSPGVPDFATQMPKEGGHVASTGQSGKRVAPMQAGVRKPEAVTTPGGETPAVGGANTARIPIEGRVLHPPEASLAAKTAYAFARLAEVMAAQEEARKAGEPWMAQDNPEAAASEPGSAAWEDFDSVSLRQVAARLAECGHAIDRMQAREATEAAAGDAGDVQDAWDLEQAEAALDAALSIVARLSFSEEAEASKAAPDPDRRLTQKAEATLRGARDHLTGVLGEDHQNTSKEETMTTSLTRDELDRQIAATAQKAAADAVAGARKADEKKARKAAKKAAKLSKNANNGGDISEQEMGDQVSGHADARDVNAVAGAGHVDPRYTKKSKAKKAKKGALAKDLAQVKDLVTRMANRPRAGGPNLTGTLFPGLVPAQEGRQGEAAAKSADDAEIEQLAKALAVAQTQKGPEAMQRVSEISYALTRKQLSSGHRLGQI